MKKPFWETKSLAQMNDVEWESLCDGCGQCCLNKLIDEETDEIYYTNVACNQLNIKTCRCKHYVNRFNVEPDCINLTLQNLPDIPWLPLTCSYRLLCEGKPLPEWHPLVTGNHQAMQKMGIPITNYACYEVEVINWEDHILNKSTK